MRNIFEATRFRQNNVTVEKDLELWGNIKGQQTIAAEHGLGTVGTLGAPQTSRIITDGTIVTSILVDLDGWTVKGTQAKDCIGVQNSLPAYIGRYVVAKYGVLYKVEMTCLVAPTEETATITQDIDLGFDGVGTMYQNDAVAIDDIVINTAALVRGETAVNNSPLAAASDNDYIYLIEGDTAATTGEYSGGQFLIKFWGHQVMT